MQTIYWKRYAHKAGPHTFRGTEYYSDPDCNNILARDSVTAKRKDSVVTLNGHKYMAIRAEPKVIKPEYWFLSPFNGDKKSFPTLSKARTAARQEHGVSTIYRLNADGSTIVETVRGYDPLP